MPELKIENPDVADLPPSAKLAYLVLQESGPCSQAELRARALLDDRTARRALNRLERDDLVDTDPAFDDARKMTYKVSDG